MTASVPALLPGAGEAALELDAALPARARTVGVFLGSFDPPHLAHQAIADALLERCDVALLLVPAGHPEKEIRSGENATLLERLLLLEGLARAPGRRLIPGLAREVLYLRLAAAVEALRPGLTVRLALGEESEGRLLDSERTFARAGLPWTATEAARLRELHGRALIFARGRAPAPGESRLALPPALRELSSTWVRALVRELTAASAGEEAWRAALGDCLDPEVLARVRTLGLYRGRTATHTPRRA